MAQQKIRIQWKDHQFHTFWFENKETHYELYLDYLLDKNIISPIWVGWDAGDKLVHHTRSNHLLPYLE